MYGEGIVVLQSLFQLSYQIECLAVGLGFYFTHYWL